MSYRLVISRRAQKSIASLQLVERNRIVYGVRDDEQIVEVLNVGHRRDVYRRG